MATGDVCWLSDQGAFWYCHASENQKQNKMNLTWLYGCEWTFSIVYLFYNNLELGERMTEQTVE